MEIMEMDAYIQKKEGMSIKDIFATNGEEYFRNCESNTLIELREKAHGCLPAAAAYPSERKRGADEKQRLCGLADGNARSHLRKSKGQHRASLLNGNMNVPFIQNLMESRREKYERAADIVIDTTGKEIETICEELLQKLSALRK